MIGTELALDPGLWGGLPAPTLAFQWRRDGVAVAGAVGAGLCASAPGDDGCALACVVTAASLAGAAMAVDRAGRRALRRPAARGGLPEEVFDEGPGVQRVETAFAFAGENLGFSATGAARGIAINAATGVLSVPTDAPTSGAEIFVAAANSGGRAETRLRYTVERRRHGRSTPLT